MTTFARYSSAVAITVLAALLRLLVQPYMGERVPFLTFFPAVFVAAIYTGFRPTLLTVFLSGLIATVFLIPPDDSILPHEIAGWMGLGLFVCLGIAVAWLSERLNINAGRFREVQEQNAVTLSGIGDGVIVTDQQERVTFLNPVAEQLTGWTLDEAKGKPVGEVFRIVNEQTRSPIDSPVTRVLREERAVGLANDTVLISRSGTDYPIDDTLSPLRSPGGKLTGCVLVFRDVTERRTAERSLQHSEQRFRSLIEATAQIVWTTDPSGQVIEDSPTWRKFTGQTLEEWQGTGWLNALHPDDRERAANTWQEAVSSRTICEMDYRLRRADGEYRWTSVRSVPVLNADGSIREWVGSNIDIHDRRQILEQLRESELRYRLVGQAANDAIWDWDLATNQVVWNEGVQTVFGYSADQVGSDATWWYENIHPEDGDRVNHGIHEAIDGGQELWQDEYRYRRVDGTYATVIDRGRIVQDASGKPVRMIGSMLDLTERKAAEERVREHAELLRITLGSIGDGVIAADTEGRVTFLNGAAQLMTGWSQADAEGQPLPEVFQIVNQTTRLKVENPALRALKEGVIVGLANHTVLIARDGTERNIDDSAAPIRDDEGHMTGAVLVFRDITEQYKVDEALRYQFSLTRTITDNATTAIFLMDEQGRCTFMNPAAETMTGYAFQDAEGKPLHELVHHHRPDGTPFPESSCPLQQALPEQSEVQDHEDYFIRRNGEFFPVLCNARPIVNEDRPVGTVIEILDLTQQKALAAKLRDSENQFMQLADAIPQLAWMARPDGHIDWYNSRWYEYTGTTFEQMEGWGWSTVHDPDMLPLVTEQWNASLSTGKPFDMVFPLRGADGKFRPFLTRVMPFRDDSGNIVRWFGTNTDVSDQQRVEEELRLTAARLSEMDRRKDAFLATLAHELRNPLAPIGTGLELLKLAPGDAVLLEEVRETMERQLQQLITIVDDLLDVSRITRGKLQLRKCRVKLGDVIQSAVEAAQPLIDEAGHELTVTVPDQPVRIEADPHRLAQVLSNLLNNAARYTPDHGRIQLVAEARDEDVVLTVRDTGIGIPAEKLEQIFEMFGQIEHPMQRTAGGLGIGLTLVRSLVEMHGGSITVRSEGDNQGSEFTVRLPVLHRTPDEESVPSFTGDASAEGGGLRVLVVDDNKAAATMLSMVVKMLGNEVRTALDGQEAITTAADFRPEVVLMDIGMPRMNGYEAARFIRQQPWGESMILVALTGWGQEEDKRRTKEAGFDHHLIKPADPDELRQLLATARPEES